MNNILTETLKAIRMDGLCDGVIFRSQKGMPYRSFRTVFERAVTKAEIANFTFHDLQHTFASRLVMAIRVDLPTVKELMGHKHMAMTLRYIHLSSDHKQRAVDTLEQFAQQVPSIFTTGQIPQGALHPQVLDFPSVPR